MMTGTSGPSLARARQKLEAAHPRHVDVGEDENEARALRRADALEGFGRRLGERHGEARGAQLLAELLAEKLGDVGLVVHDQDQRAHAAAPARGRTMVNWVKAPGSVVTSMRPAMLLDHDVVAERQAEPGAFAGGLGGEERVEHFCLHLVRNSGSIVPNGDLDAVVPDHASRRRSSARKSPFASACLRFVVA